MYNNMVDGDNLYIYLYSPGGEVAFADAIVDLINENCDQTVLIAHGVISSAAFDIFYKTICDRKILPGTGGMAHVARWQTTLVKDNQSIDEMGEFFKKSGKEEFDKRIKYYKALGFTAAELKLVQANRDCWFSENRLRTFLKNHIKLVNAGY